MKGTANAIAGLLTILMLLTPIFLNVTASAQQQTTVTTTVTSTITEWTTSTVTRTSTVTLPTFTTTSTITLTTHTTITTRSTLTRTTTSYTGTTVTYTHTRTMTKLTTTTTTMTTTTTIIHAGPHIIIDRFYAEKTSYRPGEYIGLRIIFKNIGSPGNVKVCYGITAPYIAGHWLSRCRDLGFMRSEETKLVEENDVVFAQCEYGGCDYNVIRVKLISVNDRPTTDPSEKRTTVNVVIDGEIELEPWGENIEHVIEGLRKGEVRSYLVYIILGLEPLSRRILLEITIKRLDGGLFDWDDKVDVNLDRYQTGADPGGLCSPYQEPLRISTNKGWKRFEIIVVKVRGSVLTVYPPISNAQLTQFHRQQFIAESGFKLPWDDNWSIIAKVCVFE